MEFGSRDVARAAIKMASTQSREEERQLKSVLKDMGISACAVDSGGEFITSITKIIEACVVAAKREGLIEPTHIEEGAVAGAAHEALIQLADKAIGLNYGGKLGIARSRDHIVVCAFLGLGLIHLNEVSVAVGHRVI